MGKLENNRVGILGGSFDPVHIGHLVIAERAIWELNLSKVIFIPTNISPFKENNEAKNSERFEMVKLAILDNPKFEISDIEIKRGGISYTIDTLKSLKAKFPNIDFYFIMGSDSYKTLNNWKDVKQLKKLTKFIVAKRDNSKVRNTSYIKFISMPLIDISSSMIRSYIKRRIPIRYLIPDKVRNYIYSKNLYRR